MNRNIIYISTFLLCLLAYIPSWGQANSVDLKNGSGVLINSYNSVGAAYGAIPATISQAYIIEIKSTYTGANETLPIAFTAKTGASAANTITLRPATGVSSVSISTSTTTTPIINLNDADWVRIDGRPGGTGTTRALTIASTGTGAVNNIQLINGACNNIIRYCNINNGATSSTGRGVFFTTSATNATGNSDNLVERNKFTGGRYIVNTNGTAANKNNRNKIYGNEIVDMAFTGIWYQAGTGNIEIDSNIIYSNTKTGDGIFFGILFDSQTDSAIVTRNHIYNINNGTLTSEVNGIHIRSTLSTGSTNFTRIANNFIAMSAANANSTSVHGIMYEGSSPVKAEVYYNTIRIGGTLSTGGTAGNVGSSAFINLASNTANTFDIRNNIFKNDRTGGTAGLLHVAGALSNTNGTITADYNTYNSVSGNLTVLGTTAYTSIAAHQAAVAPNDAFANDKTVNLVSATDLHVTGASLADADLKAFPILAVKNDIDNNPRGSSTYRGADDNPANPIVIYKNDIGVRTVDEPLPGICGSTADVKVTVRNYGANQVDTFTVNWSVNGVTQTPKTFYNLLDTVLGSGSITAQVTVGTFNISNGVNYTIRTWTSLPNNLPDPISQNDSVQKPFRMALQAGTYTVGGTSPDFATLTDVATTLNNYGICGAVIFNLRSGTYNEKMVLNAVAGTSTINTITFKSEANDSNSVTVTSPSGTGTGDNYVILLNGTDNVIIRQLTLERTGTATNSSIISLAGNTDNIKIYGNIFRGTTNTASDANGVRSGVFAATTSVTKDVEIYNNIFDNNSNAVWLNANTTTRSTGTKVYNNTVKCHYTGIFLAGQLAPEIYKNSITRYDMAATVDFFGISLNIVDSGLLVANNTVTGSRGYGIRFRDCNGTATKEARIINNMVTMNYSGTVSVYGIVMETGGAHQFYAHNTAVMNVDYTGTTANTGARAFYAPTTTANAFSDIRLLNNIFYNNDNGVAFYITTQAMAGITELDYNLYYSADVSLAYVGAYNVDLAEFQAATGKEVHGYNQAISFLSAKDPHVIFMQKLAFGRSNIGVTEDFDGDTRCVKLPTVGADEYTSGSSFPTASFIGPNTAVTGDRVYLLFNGNNNQVAIYSWFVNGVKQSENINLIYTFPSPGTYDIMQLAENCSGIDTFVRTYVIADPTVEPTSNFSANRNQVFAGESVKFTDLSLNGPTQWHWSVKPDNGTNVIFSDSTEQDPTILFVEPGKYEICLIAENNIGPGAQLCRTSYIEVYPTLNMCNEKVTTFEKGKIYDDAGATVNYGNNKNCSFYINPCASEVTLKFNYWTVTDVDDKLVIYDGDTSSPDNIIATVAGGMTNPGGTTGFTAKTGRMWLVWITDAATVAAGFEAEWSSVPATINPTVAGFTAPDTAFTNSPVKFTNTSTGSGLLHYWDFNFPTGSKDNNNSRNAVNPIKTYTAAGTYPVLLESTNCLGSDSVIKNIVVVDPTVKPTADFSAKLTKLNIGEVNQLFDLSANGPSSWKWEVSPSVGILFLDADTSQNPRLRFNFGGMYTVRLIATNAIGTDTVVKTAYIEVLEYCRPNVSTTNTDVTIRRVVFEQIDQSSDYGVNKYNDFSQTGKVALVTEGNTHTISIERNTNNERVNFAVWIDFNQDGDFEDSIERVVFDSASNAQILNAPIKIPAGVPAGETRMRVAISRANLTTLPCGPVVVGEYEDYKINIKADDVAPVITVIGANPVSVEVGYNYTDLGATAFDDADGNLTPFIITSGTVDTLNVGTYTISYVVTDARGNKDSVVRIVNITPDVTKPILTLNGNTTVNIEVHNSYTEDGYSAVDMPFGTNLTDSVKVTGSVDTAKLGTYVLTYTVTDNSGNSTVLTRTVIVSDTTKPVITLNGNATITHDVKTTYTDAGVTVTDNYDTALTYKVTSTVNENVLGTYTVTYTATDLSGNVAATVTRTVNVVDRVAPVIKLVGSDIIFLARWQNYVDSGYTLSDNYYDSASVKVDILGNWVNSSVEGLYYIQYRATDSSGNVSLSEKRVIDVRGTNSVGENVTGNTKVYPNPSTGRFTIETSQAFGENTVITVTNMLGAKVYEVKAPAGETALNVTLDGVNAGMYFVNITTGSHTQTTKIIIEQ